MSTDAETQNNNLVLTALFKQIDIGAHGAINFKSLAEDMGFEIKREGTGLESPKKTSKRKAEDADGDLTEEKEGVRLMQMPTRKFLKSATKNIKSRQRSKRGSDDIGEGYDGYGQDEGFESGFEDIDYTRVPDKKKKRGRTVDGYSGEEDWEA
ncbi:hypothetical protein BOTNAR_0045g00260 [Botryotinia narcissicola]|uniref:Uncharacterized protein n=1 Tax=Botryotinia narcissicola TaxID=278944 RepID=A0A4Z1J6U1_9HELO|nr:hypothetical protein BOTNAR_0045g00260 [Botryotinia narcissicola]